MGVVVESGSGNPAANSFIAVADVVTYATDRGLDFSGAAADLAAAVILGGDYLRNELRFRYNGTRQTAAQRMPYPRTGASEWAGQAIADSTVPWRLVDANAELAILVNAGISLQDDLANGGLLLASKRIDVLEKSWFKPEAFQMFSPIPGETIRTAVLGFLAPLLILPGRFKRDASLFQAAEAAPFLTGEFSNPPTAI